MPLNRHFLVMFLYKYSQLLIVCDYVFLLRKKSANSYKKKHSWIKMLYQLWCININSKSNWFYWYTRKVYSRDNQELAVVLIYSYIKVFSFFLFYKYVVTASENNSDAPSASDQQSPLRDMNNSDLISTDDDDGLVSASKKLHFYLFSGLVIRQHKIICIKIT